jgi:Lrp/AsnC ligand binding domain
MVTWAYVFISSRQPKKVLRVVRKIDGVIHADALFGSPDVVAIVTGADIAAMDDVIDQIADVPDVIATDSKVARWLDGIGLCRGGFRSGPAVPAAIATPPHKRRPTDRRRSFCCRSCFLERRHLARSCGFPPRS